MIQSRFQWRLYYGYDQALRRWWWHVSLPCGVRIGEGHADDRAGCQGAGYRAVEDYEHGL